MLITIESGVTLTDIGAIDAGQMRRTKTPITPDKLPKSLCDSLIKLSRLIHGEDSLLKRLLQRHANPLFNDAGRQDHGRAQPICLSIFKPLAAE